MICPNCKENMLSVNVFSEARQVAALNESKIMSYGSVEDISDEALDVECPHCAFSVKDLITEF